MMETAQSRGNTQGFSGWLEPKVVFFFCSNHGGRWWTRDPELNSGSVNWLTALWELSAENIWTEACSRWQPWRKLGNRKLLVQQMPPAKGKERGKTRERGRRSRKETRKRFRTQGQSLRIYFRAGFYYFLCLLFTEREACLEEHLITGIEERQTHKDL